MFAYELSLSYFTPLSVGLLQVKTTYHVSDKGHGVTKCFFSPDSEELYHTCQQEKLV